MSSHKDPEKRRMYNKEYRQKNIEKIKIRESLNSKLYRQNNKDKILAHEKTATRRYTVLKSGAKRRNLDFNLTFDDYELTFYNKPCFYCGTLNTGIDRLNSNEGYIDNNIVSCCWDCNEMKNTRSLEEFENHIIKIYNYLKNTRNNDE